MCKDGSGKVCVQRAESSLHRIFFRESIDHRLVVIAMACSYFYFPFQTCCEATL